MKALTILQPWASLVVTGEKKIETRVWQTKHRGPLLIHAGRKFTEAARNISTLDPFHACLRSHGIKTPTDLSPTLGKIIGIVDVIDCIATEAIEDIGENENAFGDYKPGRWGWILKRLATLNVPIPYQGTLGQGFQGVTFFVPRVFCE